MLHTKIDKIIRFSVHLHQMSEKTKKVVKYTLSLLLAGVLVYLACRGIDWQSFLQGLARTRWGCIALFFLAALAALVLRALRWQQMLIPLGYGKGFRPVWDAANVGNLANVLFPGAGELVRCGMVAHKGPSFERVLGTAVMERLWDFLAVGIIFVLAVVLGQDVFGTFFYEELWGPLTTRRPLLILVSALTALLCVGIWLVFRFRARVPVFRRIADRLSGFAQGVGSFFRMPRKGIFLLYTLLIWLMYLLMSYFVLKAIPDLARLGAADALFLSAVGNIASIIPVPGGIGAYHYLLRLTIVSLYGATQEAGLLFATLSHELHAVLVLLLGIISYGGSTLLKNGRE